MASFLRGFFPKLRGRTGKAELGINGFRPGWRPTVLAWTGVVVIVLIINISVLIWGNSRPIPKLPDPTLDSPSRETNTIIYLGNCDTVNSIKLWTHIAINILSSLLLLASANCMQCLSSPTREEIDSAHRQGHYLDIGILSARNFKHIDRRRALIWVFLALSSLPLHLFYNSVIVTTLGARSVTSLLVSQDFVKDTTFNRDAASALFHYDHYATRNWTEVEEKVTPFLSIVQGLMPNGPSYRGQSLSKQDCFDIFSQLAVGKYKTVALVLSSSETNQTLAVSHSKAVGLPQPWTCYPDEISSSCPICETAYLHPNMQLHCTQLSGNWYRLLLEHHDDWQIASCEAEPAPEYCGVELVGPILITVVLANVVKALAMIATVLLLRFEPVVTVGDALRTFLNHPDLVTAPGGPYTSTQLARSPLLSIRRFKEACQDDWNRPWRHVKLFWAKSATKVRWILTIASAISLEAAAGGLLWLSLGHYYESWDLLPKSMKSGIGAPNPAFFLGMPLGVVGLAVVSNAFQLAVLVVYVGLYSLFSSMLSTQEAARYTVERRSLRVSPPQYGAQRGTYWLTIPIRYGFSFLVVMTVLHWLISQSLFIVRLNRIESGLETPGGEDRIYWSLLSGLGYSPVATIAAMSVGVVVILYPLILSCRRFPPGIPIMAHNSLALAAACHRDPQDPVNVSELPLMYGVLPTRGKSGRRRVGFSSSSVEPLQHGEVYEYGRCSQGIRAGLAGLECCTQRVVSSDGPATLGDDVLNPFLATDEWDVADDDGERIPLSDLRRSSTERSRRRASDEQELLLAEGSTRRPAFWVDRVTSPGGGGQQGR